MKKRYEKPSLSITHFSADDIITTSSPPDPGNGGGADIEY